MSRVFGENSLQRLEVKDEILRCDDAELKENAIRFKDFLDMNNERATSAFCRLSKEGGLCDDLSQIRDGGGNKFSSKENRRNTFGDTIVNCIRRNWTIYWG
jgi:hypothetical protein